MGVGLIGPTAAHADVHFNGFGQIVVGSSLDNNRPMPQRTTLGNYGADPDFRSESLFALQAQATLSDSISATAQIVADGAPNGNPSPGQFTNDEFQPKFAWAYATWTINDNFSLKGGRQRLPIYHYSDYLQIGEAYPWIRPPVSVYSAPVSDYDGISLSGNFSLGDWFLQPQLYFGNFDGSIYYQQLDANLKLSNLAGGVFDASYSDWLELRAGYVEAKMSASYAEVTQLQSGINALSGPLGANASLIGGLEAADNESGGADPFAEAVADLKTANTNYQDFDNSLNLTGQTIQFSSAGMSINKYGFILDGEYVFQHSPSYILDTVAYYLSIGYKYHNLTPYFTYGRDRSRIGDKGEGNRMGQENTSAFNAMKAAISKNAKTGQLQGDYVTGCNLTASAKQAACTATNPSDTTALPNASLLYSELYEDSSVGPAPVPTLLTNASHVVNSPNSIDDYFEGGFRYDVSRSTALKLDYTYYRSPQNDTPDPGPRPSQGFQHAQLLSAAFVFTF